MVNAEQPNRSELAQSIQERTISIAMDLAMSVFCKEEAYVPQSSKVKKV